MRANIDFKNYTDSDYEALCFFFDMEFYERLGFRKKHHYSFFWKKDGK